LGGGFHADASGGQQVGSGLLDQDCELGVGVGDLCCKGVVASGQAAQRGGNAPGGVGQISEWLELGTGLGEAGR
jgi:hypothetical protein